MSPNKKNLVVVTSTKTMSPNKQNLIIVTLSTSVEENRKRQEISNNAIQAYKENILDTIVPKPYHSHEVYQTSPEHKKLVKKCEREQKDFENLLTFS